MGKLSSDGASEFEQLRDSITAGDTAAASRQDIQQQIAEIADGKFDPYALPIEGSVLDEIGTGLEGLGVSMPFVWPWLRRYWASGPERLAIRQGRDAAREERQALNEAERHRQARDEVGSEYDTRKLDRRIGKLEGREDFWEGVRQRAEAAHDRMLESVADENAGALHEYDTQVQRYRDAIRDIEARGDASVAGLADAYLTSAGGPQEFIRRVRDLRAAHPMDGAMGVRSIDAVADAVMPDIVRAFEEGRPDILGSLYRFDRPLAEEIARRRAGLVESAAGRGVRFVEPGSGLPDVPVGGYPDVGASIAQHPDVRAWRLFDDAAKAWDRDVGRSIVEPRGGEGAWTFRKVSPGVGSELGVLPAGVERAVAESVPWFTGDVREPVADMVRLERSMVPEPEAPTVREPGLGTRATGAVEEFAEGRAREAARRRAEIEAMRRSVNGRARAAARGTIPGQPSLTERRATEQADADAAARRASDARNARTEANKERVRAAAGKPGYVRTTAEGLGLGAGAVAGGAALRSLGELDELNQTLEATRQQAAEEAKAREQQAVP